MRTVTIDAPASKSLSHRVLMAAALAGGESRLAQVLESDDTARTRDVFTALGATFAHTGPGRFTVHGLSGQIRFAGARTGEALSCFVGESGTTCRLVAAILAAGQGSFRLHGAGRMHERPLGELTDTLATLGADIHFEGLPGCPPLVITAHGLDASALPGGMADIACDVSSQYLSGLLLAAPLGKGLIIRLAGSSVVSWPYISLTLETLERFGIPFRVETLESGRDTVWRERPWRTLTEAVPGKVRFCVEKGCYQAGDYSVEGDWSGASYFLAAGAIGPHPVAVRGLRADSLQGDAALLGILERMGASVRREADCITVFPSALRGIDADMGHCPDIVPTVAALAAHAQGETTIRGAAHLAIKESDRLRAPAWELARVGCRVAVVADGMAITPPDGGLAPPPPDTLFHTYGDHRMAMSLSLLGLPGVTGSAGFPVALDNPECVAKSFPRFWELWSEVRG